MIRSHDRWRVSTSRPWPWFLHRKTRVVPFTREGLHSPPARCSLRFPSFLCLRSQSEWSERRDSETGWGDERRTLGYEEFRGDLDHSAGEASVARPRRGGARSRLLLAARTPGFPPRSSRPLPLRWVARRHWLLPFFLASICPPLRRGERCSFDLHSGRGFWILVVVDHPGWGVRESEICSADLLELGI